MTKEEKKNIKIEIKSRKIVCKKLETALTALKRKTDIQKAEREKRKENLSQYKDEFELQDAYGWGFIDKDEYDKVLREMRTGVEAIDMEQTPEEIALDIMLHWKKLMLSDISDFEFQLLPEKEQNRIREQNYQILMKRKNRQEESKL